MSGVHQHIPFLHAPSLDLNRIPLAQLLSMACIGALYCMEKEQARKLHTIAIQLISKVGSFEMPAHLQTTENHTEEDPLPMWTIQSLLLCLIFGAWGTDLTYFKKHIGLQGTLALALRAKRMSLRDSLNAAATTFDEWIQQEGFRRYQLLK
jgi:hypothetical protein